MGWFWFTILCVVYFGLLWATIQRVFRDPKPAEGKTTTEVDTNELNYLEFFYRFADFGPAHGDVVENINREYERQTGNEIPETYKLDY